MAYTTIEDVRALSKIKVTDVSDEDLTVIINTSVAEINASLNVDIRREPVSEIDGVRTNKIDGENKTFYIRNWDKFISDANNDAIVDATDVIVYKIIDNVETILLVDSVVFDAGRIVLVDAPEESSALYISYSYSSIDTVTPDSLLSLSATYLAISYAYLKKDAGVPTTVKFSSISISRRLSESYGVYYDKYKLISKELNAKANLTGGYWIASTVQI